ncbi:Thioredoxin [Pleurotus pulmonarius]
MSVKEITKLADFNAAINGGKPVIIDFWAPWCGPCRQISPLFQQYAGEAGQGVEFYKVNVDECDDISQEVGIRSLPTFMVFKDGAKVDEVVGALPTKLQDLIRTHATS